MKIVSIALTVIKLPTLILVLAGWLCSMGVVFAETTTYTQSSYTLKVINNAPTFDATLKQRMVDTFFTIYPKLVARFNPNAAKTVTWTIDPNYTGVAYTKSLSSSITFSANYMMSHPQDLDVVTHEAMHIVQAYCKTDGWVTEGIADYVRYKYGVNNDAAGWFLPNYSTAQSYNKDSYQVAARFFLWLEQRIRSTIITDIDSAARNCTYSNPGTWTSLTGSTPDQLWASYAASPDISVSKPAAPSIMSAATTSNSATISWNDNSTNETGFYLYRWNSTSGSWVKIATKGANVTSHTDTGLSPSTQYFYYVSAYNGAGEVNYTGVNGWISTNTKAVSSSPLSITISGMYDNITVKSTTGTGDSGSKTVSAMYVTQTYYVSSGGSVNIVITGQSNKIYIPNSVSATISNTGLFNEIVRY